VIIEADPAFHEFVQQRGTGEQAAIDKESRSAGDTGNPTIVDVFLHRGFVFAAGVASLDGRNVQSRPVWRSPSNYPSRTWARSERGCRELPEPTLLVRAPRRLVGFVCLGMEIINGGVLEY
jgi:hypothetical protein